MKNFSFILLFIVISICCTRQSSTQGLGKKEAQAIMHDVYERNLAHQPLTELDDMQIHKVVDYYKEHGTSNELLEAYYLWGCVYRDLHEAPKAMEAFLKGIDVAETLSGNRTSDVLYRLYGQKSELLYKQCLYEGCIRDSKIAADLALKADDKFYALAMLWHVVGVLYHCGEYETVADSTWKLLEHSRSLGYFSYAAGQLCTSALANVKLNRYEDAAKLLEIYEKYSGDVNTATYESSFPVYYYVKGRLMAAKGKLDSAEVFFRRELVGSDWNNKQFAYRGLKYVFEQVGKKDSALKYARLQCEAVDSDYQTMVATNLQNLDEMYDYSRTQKENYEKSLKIEEKQRRLQFTWLLVGIVLVMMLFTFYWLYSRNERRIARASLELERANARLSESESALALLSEHLKYAKEDSEKKELTEQMERAEVEAKRQEKEVMAKQEELKQLRKWVKSRARELRTRYQGNEMFAALQEKLLNGKVAMPEDFDRVEKSLLFDDVRLMRRFYTIVVEASETDRRTFLLLRFGLRKTEAASLLAHERAAISNSCDRMFVRSVGRKPSTSAESYNWLLEI